MGFIKQTGIGMLQRKKKNSNWKTKIGRETPLLEWPTVSASISRRKMESDRPPHFKVFF